jgi:hypothetical protein
MRKTLYEKRTKYSINRLIFGNPKRKWRMYYFILYVIMILVASLINYLLHNFV